MAAFFRRLLKVKAPNFRIHSKNVRFLSSEYFKNIRSAEETLSSSDDLVRPLFRQSGTVKLAMSIFIILVSRAQRRYLSQIVLGKCELKEFSNTHTFQNFCSA